MTAEHGNRPPLAPSEAPAKSKRGRPRVRLSEDLLLRSLEGGMSAADIGKANGCSIDTVRRRIKAARAVHGAAWGDPPKPPPPVEARPLPPTAPPWAALTVKARALFDEVLEGRQAVTKLLPHQITVARAIITAPPPAESTTDDGVDHANLLAKVERAIGQQPTPAPESDMSEEDLAPEVTPDDDGAPDASASDGHATPVPCQKPTMVDPP